MNLYHLTKLPFTIHLLFIISMHKLVISHNFLSLSFICSFSINEKFSTLIWRLPYMWSLNSLLLMAAPGDE